MAAKVATALQSSKVTTTLKWAGRAGNVFSFASSAYEQWEKDSHNPSMGEREKVARATAKGLLTAGFGFLGGKAGSTTGAIVGACVGGPLCAAVGGIVGGVIGGVAGSALGKTLGNTASSAISKIGKELGKLFG